MRRSTNWILLFSTIVLAAAMLPGLALSQSGRGRPKVPTPAPGTPQPQPVTIPAAASVVKQEQVGNVSRFLLRNGITVIISEQHSAPIAASVACFKTGIGEETDAVPGISRIVGRFITAGAHRPIADLRAIGSTFHSDISFESSIYSLVAPSGKIKEALTAQADLLKSFSVDAGQLRREAARLVEEEKWGSGFSSDLIEPFGQQETTDESVNGLKDCHTSAYLLARLLGVASPGNTIAKPLNPEKLGSLTPDQVEAFYRGHYRPDKLIIAVAGDVVPFTTLVQIQQLYGDFGAQAEPSPDRGKVPERQAGRRTSAPSSTSVGTVAPAKTTETLQQNAPPVASMSVEAEQPKLRYGEDRGDLYQSIVSIGYRVPGPESQERAVIEVLSAHAGIGRASRLHSSIVDGQMAASRIDSIYLPLNKAAMLVFQIRPSGDASGASIDKAESAFFREIDRLRRELPSEAEMVRARAVLEKRLVDRTTGYAGRARELARAEAVFGGLRAAVDYRAAISAVKPEDVQRAAAKYFALSNTSVHEYESFIAPPRTFDAESFSATVLAWAPEIARPVAEASAPARETGSALATQRGVERSAQQQAEMESLQPLPVKDYSTLNGPRAFVREDRSLPKVTIALLFQGGLLVEGETTNGTTELMLRSMLYGTPRRTGQQLAQEWEQLGAEIEMVVEPDFFGFVLSVLSRNADHTLKLLRDCIEDPAFREDDIQRARVAQIGAIRDARDSSLARARELLARALYPGTPYALPPHGREELTAKLSGDQLREWHSRLVKRQLPLAIIVGDTNGSALVSSQLAEAFRRRELDTAIPVRVPGAPRPSEQIEPRRREKTVVVIGLAGPKASDHAGQDAIELIEAAMNGSGGRFDRELVEKGLAVMAGLQSDALFAAGTIRAELVTSPDNELTARNALLAQLEKLSKDGLSTEEISAAGALATTTKLDALQSQRSRVLEYARAVIVQRRASDVDGFIERFSKVTAEDTRRVAAAYLKPAGSSAGVVRASRPAQPQSNKD